MKFKKNTSPVKVIVYIKGGACQKVRTNLTDDSWEYAIADYDNEPDLPEGHNPFSKHKMGRLPPIPALLAIKDAGRKVIDNWETGDLAEAVRQLAKAIAKTEKSQKP